MVGSFRSVRTICHDTSGPALGAVAGSTSWVSEGEHYSSDRVMGPIPVDIDESSSITSAPAV
jgi:hypothetical protein